MPNLISEFISDEDPHGGLFWRFVGESNRMLRDTVATRGVSGATALAATPSFPIDVARPLIAGITLDVMSVSLGARAASAAVEAHASLARSSEGARACAAGTVAWADIIDAAGVARTACTAAEFDTQLAAAAAVVSSSDVTAEAAAENSLSATYPWDHKFPFPSSGAELAAASAPLVIVYADLGDVGACVGGADLLVDSVSAAVGRSAARAIYRHAPSKVSAGSDDTTWLAGFGVSLDIKSTEYKASDDRTANLDAAAVGVDGSVQHVRALDSWAVEPLSGSGAGDDASTWPAGVDWDRLIANVSSSRETSALKAARASASKAVQKSVGQAPPKDATKPFAADVALEPWQCADLGLQAAAFIMDAAAREKAGEVGEGADPLAALVRVTGNFPALAPWLSTLPVPPLLRKEAASNSRFAPPGTATMTLNGIVVEASNNYFNLFSLFKTLRSEARTVAMLDTLPLEPSDRRRVLDLSFKRPPSAAAGGAPDEAPAGPPTLRLDMIFEDSDFAGVLVGKPYNAAPLEPAVWLNDIEKDAEFARMPTELRTLMQPTWQLHQLRRNLYNGLVMLELGAPGSLMALHQVMQFSQMRIPIRFGVAVVPGASLADAVAGNGTLAVVEDATASSLQLALLHAAASTTQVGGGALFLSALVQAWLTGAESAFAGADASAPSEPPMITVRGAIEAFVASNGNSISTAAAGRAALADASGVLRQALARGPDAWISSLSVPIPCILFNGRVLPGLNLQQDLMGAVQSDLSVLQTAVASRQLDDNVAPSVLHALVGRATVLAAPSKKLGAAAPDTDLETASANSGSKILPGAGIGVSRFHSAVFAGDDDQTFLPLSAPEAAPLAAAAAFVESPGTGDAVKPVSLLLIDDLSTPQGLESAAATLVFARGDGVGSVVPTIAAALVPRIVAPSEETLSVGATTLRLGLLHVPPLSVAGASSPALAIKSVGDVVAVAAALITGRAPGVVDVRPDDAGPTLACVIDLARATVAQGGSGADLVVAITAWLASNPHELPLKSRAASRLSETLDAAFRSPPADLAAIVDIRASLARAADVAREMLPASLAQTRSLDRSVGDSAVMRVRALLANGRVLALRGSSSEPAAAGKCGSSPSDGVSSLGRCVTPEEVALFGQAEATARGTAVARLLATISFPPELLPGGDPDALTAEYMSGVVAMAASAVGASSHVAAGSPGALASGRISMRTELLDSAATAFTSSPRNAKKDSVGLSVVAIVDPASPDAQKTAPLLLLLRDVLGAKVTVHLVPPPGGALATLPVKTFFRYVLPATLGAAVSRPRGVFAWLPSSTILTLKLAVPEPWNVQLSAAPADCDNLKVAPEDHVPVEFSLKDLLVAGTCLDVTRGTGAYPNGLQLALSHLGPRVSEPLHDTLVMNNLGYWQLKAQPGVWAVHLKAGSRSEELFQVLAPAKGGAQEAGRGVPRLWGGRSASFGADDVPAQAMTVTVRDFTGPFSQLNVRKRAGAENERLLAALGDKAVAEVSASTGILGSISRSIFGASPPASGAVATEKPVVHVFSIASGHLYERFLKIMMVSAIKSSPSVRLKFWLVENFLSPAFKESAPRLAAALGAEVGFVTYKWPNWLRAQTEKQRIIWGYKILFLDVLFPLDVKRIIYIDADQILRTDLRELAEIDLQGAPYGFTPFCESRKETLGYQFWREGFWKDHLKGRPYHISALFVIDLVLFRRIAAGDQLRATYDQLSRDPNSLANLDQDLPNCAWLRRHCAPRYRSLLLTRRPPSTFT